MASVRLSWSTDPQHLIGLICKGLMTGLIAATAVTVPAYRCREGSKPTLVRSDGALTVLWLGSTHCHTDASLVANPELGTLTGQVADTMTEHLLWTQGERVPIEPRSTTKVMIAAAALLTLNRDAQLTCRYPCLSQQASTNHVNRCR